MIRGREVRIYDGFGAAYHRDETVGTSYQVGLPPGEVIVHLVTPSGQSREAGHSCQQGCFTVPDGRHERMIVSAASTAWGLVVVA